eukprot:421069-Rhodomonas_salina.3
MCFKTPPLPHRTIRSSIAPLPVAEELLPLATSNAQLSTPIITIPVQISINTKNLLVPLPVPVASCALGFLLQLMLAMPGSLSSCNPQPSLLLLGEELRAVGAGAVCRGQLPLRPRVRSAGCLRARHSMSSAELVCGGTAAAMNVEWSSALEVRQICLRRLYSFPVLATDFTDVGPRACCGAMSMSLSAWSASNTQISGSCT